MILADEALARLQEGNARFVEGKGGHAVLDDARRSELTSGQSPFAVILSCADSRVPPEHLFDQGLGDLFVIRVAGNIATPTQIASIEYAVQMLGTRLVVVLGHSGCGAVQAAMDDLNAPIEGLSPHLRTLVELIQPSIASLGLPDAVKANVRATCEGLMQQSDAIAELVQDAGLVIAGAEYDLASGRVSFL